MKDRSGNQIDALLRVSFINGGNTQVMAVVIDLVELRNYCDDALKA